MNNPICNGSTLGCLIADAIDACYQNGEGQFTDDLDLGLTVYASWCETPDSLRQYGSSIIQVTVAKNNVMLLSYYEPETICD